MAGRGPDALARLAASGGEHQGQAGEKNSYGRQLARVHVPQYHETAVSRLYPGKQDSGPTYQPLLTDLTTALALTAEQTARSVLRSDAGFGSDANVEVALGAGWQVLAKGKGGRRPYAYARAISDAAWQALGPTRWVASAPQPPTYSRPTQHLVLRWQTPSGLLKSSTLVCSVLDWSLAQIVDYYDGRGACETEIQADKAGLRLEHRRKKRAAAQEALILLTDVAHNLLAWARHWMFPDGPLAAFGSLRLTQDVLSVPGWLSFVGEQLVEVQLQQAHPYAQAVADGLARLLAHFDSL